MRIWCEWESCSWRGKRKQETWRNIRPFFLVNTLFVSVKVYYRWVSTPSNLDTRIRENTIFFPSHPSVFLSNNDDTACAVTLCFLLEHQQQSRLLAALTMLAAMAYWLYLVMHPPFSYSLFIMDAVCCLQSGVFLYCIRHPPTRWSYKANKQLLGALSTFMDNLWFNSVQTRQWQCHQDVTISLWTNNYVLEYDIEPIESSQTFF